MSTMSQQFNRNHKVERYFWDLVHFHTYTLFTLVWIGGRVWFLFTEKTSSELKVNQNASLQTMWERSVYLLARCVCGGSNKSIYKKKSDEFWNVIEFCPQIYIYLGNIKHFEYSAHL